MLWESLTFLSFWVVGLINGSVRILMLGLVLNSFFVII